MPESSDLTIFMLTYNRLTDRQTKPITLPLVHARGVNMYAIWWYDHHPLTLSLMIRQPIPVRIRGGSRISDRRGYAHKAHMKILRPCPQIVDHTP